MKYLVFLTTRSRTFSGKMLYQSKGYIEVELPNVACVSTANEECLAIATAFKDRILRQWSVGNIDFTEGDEYIDWEKSKAKRLDGGNK